ncbi:MAG: transcription antitermination factor NusB [Eubacteriales bacterium]|nr:transcription antitermination factor NusB [Eubacteriales bacterium]
MLRSEVREEIFKILFRYPFVEEGEMDEQIALSLEELEAKSESNRQYIKNKVIAILENRSQIDETISNNCEGWNIERIGKAELAIMRIAVYEMLLEEEIVERVAINEAVELTKRYCDEEAKGFVNAILGKIAKNMES